MNLQEQLVGLGLAKEENSNSVNSKRKSFSSEPSFETVVNIGVVCFKAAHIGENFLPYRLKSHDWAMSPMYPNGSDVKLKVCFIGRKSLVSKLKNGSRVLAKASIVRKTQVINSILEEVYNLDLHFVPVKTPVDAEIKFLPNMPNLNKGELNQILSSRKKDGWVNKKCPQGGYISYRKK